MSDLKLIALDFEDLNIISTHLQDAALRVSEMAYLPRERRFVAIANRFDWFALGKDAASAGQTGGERRRSGLRFDRVEEVKIQSIDLKDKRAVLSLLAITFAPAPDKEAPGGDVTLTFSGGAAIRLRVECIEAELRDLGAAWAAQRTPSHPED